jgi:serine/threonine protein kinase/Tol biopolymer transport system component
MPAPSTVEDFLEIVVKSGVLEKDTLGPYLQQMKAADALPPSPSKLGAAMVRDGLLTRFQAGQFLQGKWRGFWISGKYKLLDHLGQGGMGNVYLCEHKVMRRLVAIKVLPHEQAKDPAALERFHREARAAAALDHPNIVRAHDVDHDGRHHFLVMEYVEGSCLQDIVKQKGPMDVTRAAHYVRQASLGLHHAHEAGLVHRDIKPGNLLLDRQGVVKVLDMGLARFFRDHADTLTQLQDEKAILGTADYLAPEQAIDSHAVDIRADVYSLGATFYYLLAGRPPFGEGKTVAQKLLLHQMKEPPPLRELRPEVPEGLAAVVARMMAKAPDDRYQTPADVYEALAEWTQAPIPPPPEDEMPKAGARPRSGPDTPSQGVRTPPPNASTPWLATPKPTVFPSSEATGVSLGAQARGQKTEVRSQSGRHPLLQGRRPLVLGGAALAVLLIAGSLISWGLVRALSASTGRTPQPAGPGNGGEQSVAGVTVRADGDLRRVRAPNYEAAVDGAGRLVSLRVQGVELLASTADRPHGGYLAREGGKGPVRLAGLEQPAGNVLSAEGDGAALRYEFGPDRITCTATNLADERLSFFLFVARATAVSDGQGDFRRAPVGQEEWGTSVWYSGPARLKVTGGTRVWGAPGEPHQTCYAGLGPRETRALVLEAGAVSDQEAYRVRELGQPAVAGPAGAPPRAALSSVCVLSVADGKERVLLESPDRWDSPVFTPDGQAVLCVSKGKLYQLPLAGGPRQEFRLGTLAPGRDYTFSPDGQRLAITVGDAMWLVPAMGGPPAMVQPKKSGYVHAWTADGQALLYTAGRGGPLRIFRRPADGGDEAPLLAHGGFSDAPDATRDGKWIYYCCDKSGKVKVWRIPAAGAGPNDEKAEQVTDDGPSDWFPHPSPDGKWLLFLSDPRAPRGTPEREDVVLRLMPLPGDKLERGSIQEVRRFIGGQGTINAPCWSPDGKSIAYVRYAPK